MSTLVAASPVLILLGLLASGKASAWQAALAGLLTAAAAAIGVFGIPADLAAMAALQGVGFALFRIIWLIVAAVFLYDIAVVTGQFEIMKASVARLSGDRRVQAVLVAFAFGAFIEGAAGFGAPVAISAAFLVGLGFEPFQAALLCLIANTAPVAWGAIGTPIKTLAGVTSLNVEALSATAGRILPPLSFLIPFWLVCTMSGWRATLAVWPALVVVGGAFAGSQFVWSNFVGVDLVDILSAVSSLLAGVVLLKFWKPREEWRFSHDAEGDLARAGGGAALDLPRLSAGQVARAWMPFALLTVTVLIWGLPSVKTWMDAKTPHRLPFGIGPEFHLSWKLPVPRLNQAISKGAEVSGHGLPVAGSEEFEALMESNTLAAQGERFALMAVAGGVPENWEKAEIDIVPLASTGTAVFLAAIVSGLLLGVRPFRLTQMLWRTIVRLTPAIAAISFMLALGFVTKASGMDAVLGLAFTRTGRWLYPIFGTLLGWLGVALTGSDTSSNVLFGNLQRITAEKLGLNPILMASANSTGGVMGKMIDAQSIVVAAAATGEGGKEGDLLRAVFWHSIALAMLVGVIVWLYAHVVPWVVPPMPSP